MNSERARTIEVSLVKCLGGEAAGCKNETEITDFFRKKYLINLHNEIQFDSGKYGSESVESMAKLSWYRINTQMRTQFPLKIS